MRSTTYSKALFGVAIALVFIWLVPVMWVMLTSIKPTNIINSAVPVFLDFNPTFDHYVEVYERFRFGRAMTNSFITVGVSTLIVMIVALPAAYAVARMNLMHGDAWALVILSLRFMPGMVIVLPYFKDSNISQYYRYSNCPNRGLCGIRSSVCRMGTSWVFA